MYKKININNEQMEILKHTLKNSYYCGDSVNMRDLCKQGLMKFAGTKSFVPDKYFSITEKGKHLLKSKLRSKS